MRVFPIAHEFGAGDGHDETEVGDESVVRAEYAGAQCVASDVAMSSFETTDQLLQTRGAILFLEMFGRYSVTSDELIAGLPVEP